MALRAARGSMSVPRREGMAGADQARIMPAVRKLSEAERAAANCKRELKILYINRMLR